VLKKGEKKSFKKRALVPSLLPLCCSATSCRVVHSFLVERTTNKSGASRLIHLHASRLSVQNAASRTSLGACSSHCNSEEALALCTCMSPTQSQRCPERVPAAREGRTMHCPSYRRFLSALLRRDIFSALVSPHQLVLCTINILAAYRPLKARMKAHVETNLSWPACGTLRLHEAAYFGKHNEANESSADSSG
jgi:hypothetical protein